MLIMATVAAFPELTRALLHVSLMPSPAALYGCRACLCQRASALLLRALLKAWHALPPACRPLLPWAAPSMRTPQTWMCFWIWV